MLISFSIEIKMTVHPISSVPDPIAARPPNSLGKASDAAEQFEGILLRQFLSESMKPLLQGGAGGQVYGYLITESLSSSLVKGGGLGLSSVIQAQLSPKTSR